MASTSRDVNRGNYANDGVAAMRISAILKGQHGITTNTILRSTRYVGGTPQVRLNLQKTFPPGIWLRTLTTLEWTSARNAPKRESRVSVVDVDPSPHAANNPP